MSTVLRFVAVACVTTTAFLAAPAAQAQTAQASPSQSDIDQLVEDIAAHKSACPDSDPHPSTLCVNEAASLAARQKRLGIADDALNAKLKTRGGWRWP